MDAVNEIGPLAGQVIPSHSAKSHDFYWICLEEFIRKMCFHLPLFALTIFRTSQKPPQARVKTFLRIKGFFIRNLAFPSLVSQQYFKMHIKQGDGNPAISTEDCINGC